MNKNTSIAASVIELVGNKENINDMFHCMTRLRFKLKDTSVVDIEKIKAVDGVLGVQFAEETLQVITQTSHKVFSM